MGKRSLPSPSARTRGHQDGYLEGSATSSNTRARGARTNPWSIVATRNLRVQRLDLVRVLVDDGPAPDLQRRRDLVLLLEEVTGQDLPSFDLLGARELRVHRGDRALDGQPDVRMLGRLDDVSGAETPIGGELRHG